MENEAFDCPVCSEPYTCDDGGHRTPKVLPCAHTVCGRCLHQMTSGRKVKCPVCRVEAPQSQIKVNFGMRDMIKAMQQNAAPLQQGMNQPLLGRGNSPSAPPAMQAMTGMPSAPTAGGLRPWEVGREDIYNQQALQHAAHLFHAPDAIALSSEEQAMVSVRKKTLLEWGLKRERKMHRAPCCLMDQMMSGSGYYPIRLLDDSWFTESEKAMIVELEKLFESTGHQWNLARDMLTPRIFDIDVRIILDNSGSMNLDMFGNSVYGNDILAKNVENPNLLQQTLQQALPISTFSKLNERDIKPAQGGLSPFQRRWFHARDTLLKWQAVFKIMGIDPWVYTLNPVGRKTRLSNIETEFYRPPGGTTPMTNALEAVLRDATGVTCDDDAKSKDSTLILAITDGEADDMTSFTTLLDRVQNMCYGDVQVGIMGISLLKEDIEWFENEECDETRIRTIEAYEVEQRQIQMKDVVRREGNYNYTMHTYRALVTNYFPADYDYEAHLQNLRHRLYITIHGRDRWYGIQNPCWKFCCSGICCTACFLVTCCHCNGWCQGNECGKYEKPELLEACVGEE